MTAKQPLAIEKCNCFAIRKASRQITSLYDALLEPTGLRITQFLTLTALNELGAVSINILAEQLDVERTAMGKMVATLERDGLLVTQRSPTDGRSRLIELTDSGRRLQAQASPLWQEAQRQFRLLNGEQNVTILRRALAGLVVGDEHPGSSED